MRLRNARVHETRTLVIYYFIHTETVEIDKLYLRDMDKNKYYRNISLNLLVRITYRFNRINTVVGSMKVAGGNER